MKNLTPSPKAIPDFTPVPRKYRFDGWTPERQRAFIAALAETGSVTAAAARINMSTEGAYYLRRQPGADSFRAAWAAALDHGVQSLTDLAIDRAREGVPVPVFWKGEQVGERRRYNDGLLMFVLRHHLPERYDPRPLPGGTKHPETLAREADEAKEAANLHYAELARGLAQMMCAHRVHLREARVSLLMGDPWGAADSEYRARQIEQLLVTNPDDWGVKGAVLRLEILLRNERESRPAEDDPAFCRSIEESIEADDFPENAPSMSDWRTGDGGIVIPDLPIPYWIRRRGTMTAGPSYARREAARRSAERRIEEAKAEWIAAGNEEQWAAWLEGR